jgi:oligoendopeptidase F
MTPTTTSDGFVPAGFDGTEWAGIEPLMMALLDRPVRTAADLERWLLDRSDLEAACSEARADLYIATTCHTDDEGINAAYTRYIENVEPKIKPLAFELDKKFVGAAAGARLDSGRYGVLERSKRASVDLFRSENVPIQTELAKLAQEFGKIAGAQTVTFDGAERTLAQMGRYLQSTDRPERESAWRTIAARRLADRGALDTVLDRMVALRHAMARNAGCADYVGYAFKENQRFDYAPADCEKFWSACERHVVPLMRRLDEQRRAALGVAVLRPWDLAVDVKGRPALRPFEGGRDLVARSLRAFEGLDGRLAGMMAGLAGKGPQGGDAPARHAEAGAAAMCTEFLDLDSRKGKRPGGYMYVRDRSRRPFIFMNAAGLQRDVMTMVHEAGHAFHAVLCADEPLLDYRHSPIEFAEVASMSMEHLTMAHWGGLGGFYERREDWDRARREHLEDSVVMLNWIAMIDRFQHWMYREPTHTRAQRDDFWQALDERMWHATSWEGLGEERRSQWQKQGHLYSHAMYYIEYGIAQMGAMQLWVRSQREGERAAVDAYLGALRLGGSRLLPELFKAAGVEFDFGAETVRRVVKEVERELERLGD